jgi:hypothetical protein
VGFTRNHTLLWFLKPIKKIRETRNPETILKKAFCRTGKREKKGKQKLEPKKPGVYAQKPRQKIPRIPSLVRVHGLRIKIWMNEPGLKLKNVPNNKHFHLGDF